MKVPSKFFNLPGAGDDGIPSPLQAPLLGNPGIEGFRWRQDHWTIRPSSANSYNWAAIDAALVALVGTGQKMGLSVAWGDAFCKNDGAGPEGRWIYDDAGVEEFTFDPTNEVGSMPQIFDPLYLPILLDFIAQMGAIYNPHPNVAYVVVSGVMQHFEGYLCKTADEETRMNTAAINAGFDDLTDGWLTICKQVVSAFVTAFPDTAVLYTSAKPFPSDAGGVQQSILRDWIADTYPGHAGWMTAQLKAVPGPWPPAQDELWPHGFQAIHSGQVLEDIYGTGHVPDPPPVPPQIMIDFINNGLSKGAQFLEIYEFDMKLAANQGTFVELAPLFHSFTDYIPPGTSVPPTSLPTTSIPVSVPSGSTPPEVILGRPVVARIVQCRTGTHARNIILARKRLGPPVIVPTAPGPVEILDVVTPHLPSSGTATATWLSPVGSDPDNLSYIAFLTGGSGTITITDQEPV